jgi:hypothetical protein
LLTASAVLSASSSLAANGTNSVKQATAVLAASSSMFDGVTQRQMVSAVLAATASLVASPAQIGSIVTRSAQQFSVQSWPHYWQKLPTIGRVSFIPPSNVGATLSAGGSMIARATVRQAATAILGASASVRATGSGGSTATFFTLGQESDTLARPWRWYRDEGYSVPSFLPTPSGPQVLQATAILAASSSIRALASGAVTQQATAVLAATTSIIASVVTYRIVARNALLGQTRRWPRYNVLSEVFQRGHNQTVTIQTATAILAANASLIAAPNQVMQAATVLAATSSLIVAGTRYSPTSAVLSASSQLSANANQRMAASATLTATASLVAATTQRMIGKVVLAASASLVADSSTGTAPQGSAVLAATASLISSAIRFSPTSAVLAASGAMIASSTSIILAGRSTMAASASVIADTRMALAAYAGLQATSAMIAAPGQVHVETVSQIFVAETAMIANGFVHGPVPTEPSADHTMIGPPFLILGQ